MRLSLPRYAPVWFLLTLATTAGAAPTQLTKPEILRGSGRVQAAANLPRLAAAIEATNTQLVGLLASGDVKRTFTTLEDNLTTSSNWRFEARTTQAKATRLLWQVAVMPYPEQTGQAWQSPLGLVDSGMLPNDVIPDAKRTYPFNLNLGYYLNVVRLNQPLTPQGHPLESRTAERSSLLSRWISSSGIKQVQFGWGKIRVGTGKIPGGGSGTFRLKKTEKVITFYIRVVPLDAKGERVGNPSPMVSIRHNAQPSDFTFAQSAPTIHPTVTPIHWQPERHQDPNANYWRLVVRRPYLLPGVPGVPQAAFSSVAPGQKYSQPIEVYWPPSDKSWWDKVCDAAGDFIGWVADVVNFVSNLYSSIKGVVIDGLAQIAPELRGVFSIALDVGLAAVGIPPSLPDFDDLQSMGVDYMCSYIGDETGIPSGITKEALQQIAAQTKDARQGGSDAGIWVVPDYNKLYRPARLDLRVTNHSAQTSDRVTVFCDIVAVTAQGQRLVAASNPVPLPLLKPNETLEVPVYIQGAPEYANQVRLNITTQVRYELNDKGLPIMGKSTPSAEQYNRRINAKQVWDEGQLQQAPKP